MESNTATRYLGPTILFVLLVAALLWQLMNIVNVAGGRGLTVAGVLAGIGTTSTGREAKRTADGASATLAAPAQVVGASGPASGAVQRMAANQAIAAEQPAESVSAPRAPARDLTRFPKDLEMLTVLFALCGGLGATLHALGSLVAFTGNGKFVGSWALWYLAQPLRGAVLACGFFWLFQGGLLGGVSDSQFPVNGMAMMGATFLVGLFSDAAIEKLREVFQVVFRTADKQHGNPLAPIRKPVVTGVSFDAARPATLLTIEGKYFGATDKVSINDAEQVVSRRSARSLDIALDHKLNTTGTPLKIVVTPTQAGCEASEPFEANAP